MKFLCDSCKAKYQIADEKVAGKTVRMKCRKCGHQIEVRAAVTETSVEGVPPRALTATPNATKPPPKPGLATSLSAAKPRPPAPAHAPSGGALSSAFQRNVQNAPARPDARSTTSSLELSVTDEWYVAINGVPVGPVRISELRRKAASGGVTEESLCWQEGLEEWRPIRSIPDLAALVREAAHGNRPSLAGAPPEVPSQPAPPPPPRPPTTQRLTPPPPAPASRSIAPSLPTAALRSNVVPLRPAAAALDDHGVDDHGLRALGANAPAAALAPSLAPAAAPTFEATPSPVLSAVPDPFAVPASVPVPTPLAASAALFPERSATASIAPPPPQGQKKGVPLWLWPIVAVALGFGGTLAFAVFRPQPVPAPVVIQMAPTATAAPAKTEVLEIPEAPSTTEAPATSAETKKVVAAVAKGTTPAKPEEKKGLDLGSLVPGAGGPNVGPNASPGAGAGGGLDQAGVERVVAGHRPGVKRTCWERGGADQKSSVNVTVSASVAPNGSVVSTSSSGDDPVVAKCIENQVKTWQFPAPGSSTTINIPFKFVRQ